jgi:hypothetical protein
MTGVLSAFPPCVALAPAFTSRAADEGMQAPAERASLPGCNGFDRKACDAAARRVAQSFATRVSARGAGAPADTPAALRAMAALAQEGVLQPATPSSVKPGPDGVAVRPNERFISVLGTINGARNTLLTAVSKRDNASAPWRMAYTIGAGAVQMRIQQQPIAGQPGRFKTTIGPLDADLDLGGFGPPVQLNNTGPLVVQAAADGRSATATIDGEVVFPARRSDLAD